MIKRTLYTEGNFYKGNLHAHTALSDGRLSPEQLIAQYKAHGYDFLSITDHNLYGRYAEITTPSFLMLPGVEMDVYYIDPSCGATYEDGMLNPRIDLKRNPCYNYKTHHIVGIGRPGCPFPHGDRFLDFRKTLEEPQQIIDFLHENDNIVIYCHPYVSKITIEDLAQLRGYDGLEVFNYDSQVECLFGESDVYYDHMMWRKHTSYLYATDDTHQSGAYQDWCGGFIRVKAPALTHEAITQALDDGSFYASSGGPEIYDFFVEDGVSKISCAPCAAVYFITDRNKPSFHAQEGRNDITRGEFRPKWPTDRYARAVCVDQYGRKSWTQPIFWED